jgi:hypothetical protein
MARWWKKAICNSYIKGVCAIFQLCSFWKSRDALAGTVYVGQEKKMFFFTFEKSKSDIFFRAVWALSVFHMHSSACRLITQVTTKIFVRIESFGKLRKNVRKNVRRRVWQSAYYIMGPGAARRGAVIEWSSSPTTKQKVPSSNPREGVKSVYIAVLCNVKSFIFIANVLCE